MAPILALKSLPKKMRLWAWAEATATFTRIVHSDKLCNLHSSWQELLAQLSRKHVLSHSKDVKDVPVEAKQVGTTQAGPIQQPQAWS